MLRSFTASPNQLTAFIAIMAVGAALRLAGLGAGAVWYDEAYQSSVAALPPVEIVRVATMDSQPPLSYLLVAPLVHLFGETEIAIRLPSAIAAIVSLALAWLVATELRLTDAGRAVGAAALAVLPYQLWLAQDARVYAVFSALYLAAIWFGLKGRWLGLAACVGLGLYAHFAFAFYAAPLAVLLWLWHKPRRSRAALTLSMSGGAAAFALYLPFVVYQLSTVWWFQGFKGSDHLQALNAVLLANVLPQLWTIVSFLLLFVSLVAAVVITINGRSRALFMLAALTLGPFALMWASNEFWKPVLFYRTASALAVPLVLWIVEAFARSRLRWLAAAAWSPLVLAAVLVWSPTFKGSSLKMYSYLIRDNWRGGDVIYHATGTTYLPFRFYLADKPAYLLDEPDFPASLLGNVEFEPLKVETADLDALEWDRAWVVWARDPLLPPRDNQRMGAYLAAHEARFVGRITYWQAAPIEVWILERQP